MPADGVELTPHEELLSTAEILRLVRRNPGEHDALNPDLVGRCAAY